MKGDKDRSKTWFKAGNVPHNKGTKAENSKKDANNLVKWTRPPHNISQCVLQRAETESDFILKYLRPTPPERTYADLYREPVIERPESNTYRIFHSEQTEKLWNTGVSEHRKYNPLCTGMLIFDHSKEVKVGLACKQCLKCTECGYT